MHGVSRWDDLKIVLACIEAGSLSAAATTLGVQQSTVSRRLGALEQQVGAPLFTRTAEGVIPTELAVDLRPHAEAMREHILAIERQIAGHEPSPKGVVRLACLAPIALYAILPALDSLTARHPDLRLDIIESDVVSDLERGEADIALRFARSLAGDLVGTRAATLPQGIYASRSYLERHGQPTASRGRWVTVALPFLRTEEEEWYEQHIEVEPWLRTNSYVTASEAIAEGYAVGIATSTLEKVHPDLVEVDIGVPRLAPLEMWLITHRNLRQVPRIDAVWQWLRELAAEHWS